MGLGESGTDWSKFRSDGGEFCVNLIASVNKLMLLF